MKIITGYLFMSLFCLAGHAQQVTGNDTTRQIKIEKGQVYLNLPVSESARLKRVRILYQDKLVDQFAIKLAPEKPDYWVYFDAGPYQGKLITLQMSAWEPAVPGGTVQVANTQTTNVQDIKAFKMIVADSRVPGFDSVYKETLRPQVHFSAKRGWINDPNGLIYHNGEYHLYFQHNPYGWAWGNMHWGHAVSRDLVHWDQLPEAIYPFNDKDAAFSGSAVVDVNNTSGFRKNGIDPLIAIYTSTGRGECLKMSYDNGRTFSDYEANPVLVHKGRDPKVFWYEPGRHWVMVVWDNSRTKKMGLGQEALINQNLIYTSPDLKNWTFQSGVPGFFECPELFELPVEGEPGKSRWIMYDATGRYIVGDFDGKKFTIVQHLKKYDYGGGYFYASQTYNNIPDKRKIQVGWGRGIVHTGMPFNQAMLFPTELKLKPAFDGLRLCPSPIKEISKLHSNSQFFNNKIIKPNEGLTVPVKGDALHIIAEFEKGDGIPFGLNILGYELSYNDLLGQFTTAIGATHSTTEYVKPDTEIFRIEAIADKNILEVFVNDGELYYAVPFNEVKTGKVDVFVKGRGNDRKTILKTMEVHELKSAWEQ